MIDYKVYTQVNQRGIDHTFHHPAGPLARHLHKIGRRMVTAAQGQVGKATLSLMNSIHYNVDMVRGFPKLTVSADDPIALIHHEGTRPHAIAARNSQVLRYSANGRINYARTVMHPGTPPNRYLSDNLYIAKG